MGAEITHIGILLHPIFSLTQTRWIVVQGSHTNLRGRFVEHIGYYLPRKGATVQRAVILNKPRIRYWLAVFRNFKNV